MSTERVSAERVSAERVSAERVSTVDRAEHTAARPGWSCAVCREPWPCPPAKADLAEQYRGQLTALRIYIAGQLWNAIDDAMLTERGPSPCGLRGRFLDWVDRLARGEREVPRERPALERRVPGAAIHPELAKAVGGARVPARYADSVSPELLQRIISGLRRIGRTEDVKRATGRGPTIGHP